MILPPTNSHQKGCETLRPRWARTISPSCGFVSTPAWWPSAGSSHKGPLALGTEWVRSHAVYFPLQVTKSTTDWLPESHIEGAQRASDLGARLGAGAQQCPQGCVSVLPLLCLPRWSYMAASTVCCFSSASQVWSAVLGAYGCLSVLPGP